MLIDRYKIDGVGQPKHGCAVTWHPVGWAIANLPPAGKGIVQHQCALHVRHCVTDGACSVVSRRGIASERRVSLAFETSFRLVNGIIPWER